MERGETIHQGLGKLDDRIEGLDSGWVEVDTPTGEVVG